MRRGITLALLLGWLLGVGTATFIPDLRYERRTMLMGSENPLGSYDVRRMVNEGWRITGGDSRTYYDLERPRLRLP